MVEASLVAFFKDDKNFKTPQSAVQEATLILTYSAIILSISATISALTLTDELGDIPSRASRDLLHTSNPAQSIEGKNWAILRHFGARKSTRWITYHCRSTDQWLPCAFLITNKLHRDGLSIIGQSMCRCLYCCICRYTRDPDSRIHRHSHWRRDLTSPVPFPHMTLDHMTKEILGLQGKYSFYIMRDMFL